MRRSPHTQDDRGVAIIEFVFVMPLLLMLIVAIAQFGLYYSANVDAQGVARDAARSLALRQTPNYGGYTPSGVATCAVGDTTNNATVTLTGSYTFSLPLIDLGTKAITATGKMRCGG
jgi:Flp pilus assembly protein TadG